MGSVFVSRPVAQRRSVWIAVGVALLAVVLIVGLAFANAVSASRVADNARSLHWTNATLGTASATRLALVQATTFVELAETGQATVEDADFAMTQATEAYSQLVELESSGGTAVSMPYLTHFLGPVEQTLASLETGDAHGAHSLIMGGLEASYIELVDAVHAEQADIQAQIDANTEGAARTSDFVRFFLTFAIPASAVLIYRVMAKRAVRELQLKAELEIQAERDVSRAKDAFIAGLSHELRTPLTSIYGFAEVLTEPGEADAENTREMATIIANEAAEMTRMVDDLLAAARIESTGVEVEMAPTRVSDVVASAITPFARAGLEIKSSSEDVWVSTDAARLRHVIINLLSNAARHGGPEIGVEVSAGDDTVDIEVWDNGPGVPEEQIANLFDRFIHSGAAPLLTGSVGMGLAVASRLTTLLGGRLSYQRFAQKSYFIISLPGGDVEEEAGEVEAVADVIRALSA